MNLDRLEGGISLGLFYFLLAIFSLGIAATAAWIVKRRFSNSYGSLFLFFWTFNMIAPLIGAVATLWISIYLVTVRYEKVLTETHTLDMSEIYSEFPQVQRIFGEASMGQILTSKKVPDSLKMKALVSLAENTRKNEITLIKKTLSDRNDEIRLYSFATIDKLERNINSHIYLQLDLYQKTEDSEKRARIAGEIAHLYWEMLYFELADEDLASFLYHTRSEDIGYDIDTGRQDSRLRIALLYLLQLLHAVHHRQD